jgi:hypothetical protein
MLSETKSRFVGKKIIYIIICLLFFTQQFLSQEKDSLIQLYSGLGDTLDRFDRDYFELLQNIEGFKSATFYIRDNKYLVSNVVFIDNGNLYDTISIQNISALQEARSKIGQSLLENETKYNSPREVIISTRNGKTFSGNLDMFSKDNLYLSSIQDFQTGESTDQNFLIPVFEIDTITFVGESNVLSSMGWGALIGFALGVTIGFVSGSDSGESLSFPAPAKAGLAGGGLGLIGGIIGLIFGLTSSADDEVFRVESQSDVLKLKDYAKYHLRYDEAIEQEYEISK